MDSRTNFPQIFESSPASNKLFTASIALRCVCFECGSDVPQDALHDSERPSSVPTTPSQSCLQGGKRKAVKANLGDSNQLFYDEKVGHVTETGHSLQNICQPEQDPLPEVWYQIYCVHLQLKRWRKHGEEVSESDLEPPPPPILGSGFSTRAGEAQANK